jgi:hypothetical protein
LHVIRPAERTELVHKLVHRSDLWTRPVQHTDNGCPQTLDKRLTLLSRDRSKITREASDGRKRCYMAVHIGSRYWAKAAVLLRWPLTVS